MISGGPDIRARRRQLGLTQPQLAERSGVSLRTLRDVEKGNSGRDHSRSIRLLAVSIGLDVPELVPGPDSGYGQPFSVGVLGPLTVRRGETPIAMPRKSLSLLGLLALRANKLVSQEEIVDVVWGDQPTDSYRNLIYTNIARLRKQLQPGGSPYAPRITAGRGGYTLEVDRDHLDLLQFDEFLARASAPSVDTERQLDWYDQALACWRGPVLADLSFADHPVAAELARRRLTAGRAYARLALATGQPERVIVPLSTMTAEEPLHEGLHAQLMVALAGSGQQAAALEVFTALQTRIADELGLDLGAEMVDARMRVLRREVVVQAVPRQVVGSLPRAVPDFTGRATETRVLIDRGTRPPTAEARRGPAVAADSNTGESAASVMVIDGMAGIGKTATAVHVAHQLTGNYPDGQLFIDLHGHTAGRTALTSRAALDRLLRAVGVEGRLIPQGLDECVASWRSVLASRRMLIVLDNAESAAQVRPLLPSGPGCLVLVTSRDRLAGLEGVDQVSLPVLPESAAIGLLSRIAGRPDSPELRETARLCGHLPLAIRIVAARLRHRPMLTVEHLNARLRRQQDRLAELTCGDLSVRAAFSMSYERLPASRQRVFRQLSVHPGADIDDYAVAALAGIEVGAARQILDDLLDVHLLEQRAPGRYRFHDLVRDYALRAARKNDTDAERFDAFGRLLDYHLVVAEQAATVLDPGRRRLDPKLTHAPISVPLVKSTEDAQRWLDGQRANLVALIAESRRSHPDRTWRLARSLWRHFMSGGHHRAWQETHQHAIAAAEHLADLAAMAETLKNLGLGTWLSGDPVRAAEQHERALDIHRRIADPAGQANTLNQLGFIRDRMGDYPAAYAAHKEARDLYRAVGDNWGVNRALVGLASAHYALGRRELALRVLAEALATSTRIGDRWGECLAHTVAGVIHVATDVPALAKEHLERAVAISRRMGDQWTESLALIGLGRHLVRTGSYERAGRQLRQAIELGERTGDRWVRATAHVELGELARRLGQDRDARVHQQRALTLARAIGHRELERTALSGLAVITEATSSAC